MLTETDLIQAGNPMQTGVFVRLGEYKLLAGELISLGFGVDKGSYDSSVGRIYSKIMDNSTPSVEVTGTFRLTAMTSFDRPSEILFETNSRVLDQHENDRPSQLPLPQNDLYISQDKRIELSFSCDLASNGAVISTTGNKIMCDITRAAV